MNAGQVLSFLWTVAAVFFLLSVFVFPVLYVRWRHAERLRQQETDAALARTRPTLVLDHSKDILP